ncbi:MAG: DUF1294 domain-containing protein [Bacteroidales bacterium]|nr:DUF1294 domain-containing protein [Bacteroidales bacterium]
MRYIIYYLLIINVVGGIVFAVDKQLAKKEKTRVPEATLHLFEAFGAFPIILLLMYTIHHKNKKAKYFLITWLIALLWLGVVAILLYKKLSC